MPIPKEDRIVLRKSIKKYKSIRDQIKPLEKQKDEAHKIIKQIVEKYEQDFDTPEGRTDSRPFTREGYDRNKLDELLESGLIDEDTKQLILNCRYSTDGYSLYIL